MSPSLRSSACQTIFLRLRVARVLTLLSVFVRCVAVAAVYAILSHMCSAWGDTCTCLPSGPSCLPLGQTRAGSPGRYARSAPFPAPGGATEQVKGILEVESNGSW